MGGGGGEVREKRGKQGSHRKCEKEEGGERKEGRDKTIVVQQSPLSDISLTCLNPLSSSELDAPPCMEVCTMDLARDLELPGLPTRKSGIRSSMQIAIIKTFSRRAAFLAMFGPRVMLSSSTS